MSKFSKGLIRILTSLKLTVTILVLIILSSLPATLIVQNQSPDFYLGRYPQGLSSMILIFGFDSFFTSDFFLILIAVFWINLASCTLRRLMRQLKIRRRGRYGPDILHIGLLILIVGAMISLSTRREGTLFLAEGDAMLLPSGRYLNMDEFIYQRYPDGRPMEWTSVIRISETLDSLGEEFLIEVNHPLRIDKLVIYQAGYRPGKPGTYETGLLITEDRGKAVILISFMFITAGLFLTIYQKRKEL